jgi:hypothetical protein
MIKNKVPLPHICMEVTSKSTLTIICVMGDLLLGFLTLKEGTDRLSQNVGKELPLLAA